MGLKEKLKQHWNNWKEERKRKKEEEGFIAYKEYLEERLLFPLSFYFTHTREEIEEATEEEIRKVKEILRRGEEEEKNKEKEKEKRKKEKEKRKKEKRKKDKDGRK